MRGVKSEDLLAIVDFLYFGEANVNQENLDSFLALAEELQLQGLMEKVCSDGSNQTNAEPTFQEKKNKLLDSNSSISKAPCVSRNDANAEFSNISQDDKTAESEKAKTFRIARFLSQKLSRKSGVNHVNFQICNKCT